MSSVAAIINTAKDIPSTDFFNTHEMFQQRAGECSSAGVHEAVSLGLELNYKR
jgi:hypothetical protein